MFCTSLVVSKISEYFKTFLFLYYKIVMTTATKKVSTFSHHIINLGLNILNKNLIFLPKCLQLSEMRRIDVILVHYVCGLSMFIRIAVKHQQDLLDWKHIMQQVSSTKQYQNLENRKLDNYIYFNYPTVICLILLSSCFSTDFLICNLWGFAGNQQASALPCFMG